MTAPSRPSAQTGARGRGVAAALAAACFFGLSAPLAKLLLPGTGPLALAGLLYLGAGCGLSVVSWARRGRPGAEAALRRSDLGLLAGIVLSGGLVGPVLLLLGLQRVSGVAGALLLNLEAPLTILLAVALFGEHMGLVAAAGAAVIAAGAAVLGLAPGALGADPLGVAAVAGACASWAVDNNLTQRLSLRDPIAVARVKGLAAGAIALTLATATGQTLPAAGRLAAALAVGFASYGVSVALAVHALRLLGAARQAALFSTAPFMGALAAVPLLGESLGLRELLAAAMMAAGVALLVRERHDHVHEHGSMEHDHAHVHDDHHQHDQHDHAGDRAPAGEPHAHAHAHARGQPRHAHPHTPDEHHRHRHRHRG